jgi:hypothetical protein
MGLGCPGGPGGKGKMSFFLAVLKTSTVRYKSSSFKFFRSSTHTLYKKVINQKQLRLMNGRIKNKKQFIA